MYQWGSFSKNIPGRVGYQCSNYYRTLIKSGEVEDSNYMTDEKGELRFNFKNKGFERKNKDTGVSEIVTIKPRKPKPPPKPKPVKVPKPPKPKKEKKPKKPKPTQEEREDKDFRCSAKFETTRRSGRNAGKEKKYTEDGEEEEEEEAPVLPGFVDPLTKMQVEEPAISPYGHVAGYETWCRILRQEGTKDTCPFTRQPLKRRELVKLTHENIAEYREKMVDTQQGTKPAFAERRRTDAEERDAGDDARAETEKPSLIRRRYHVHHGRARACALLVSASRGARTARGWVDRRTSRLSHVPSRGRPD